MITKNYIKMCGRNEDLQKGHKFVEGDWFYFKNDNQNLGSKYNCVYPCILSDNSDADAGVINDLNRMNKIDREYIDVEDEGIWLPTQEQLQEMILISKKYTDMFILNNFLCDFIIDDLDKKNRSNMNEIWLAFVMKQKYNKVWDGNKWK